MIKVAGPGPHLPLSWLRRRGFEVHLRHLQNPALGIFNESPRRPAWQSSFLEEQPVGEQDRGVLWITPDDAAVENIEGENMLRIRIGVSQEICLSQYGPW